MGRSLNEHFFTFSLFTFRSREIVSKNEASMMAILLWFSFFLFSFFFYQPLVMLPDHGDGWGEGGWLRNDSVGLGTLSLATLRL